MKKRFISVLLITSLSFMGCSTGNNVKDESPLNETSASEIRNQVIVPDIVGVDEITAKSTLAALGIIPLMMEEYSDETREGTIIRTEPSVGSEVNLESNITLYKSKGPKVIQSQDSTIKYWNVSGSDDDNYVFLKPYIEDNSLIIRILVTFNSDYTMEWDDEFNTGYGSGNATLDDYVVKVVPFEIKYVDKQIIKGETQNVTLKIPLTNLNIDKPTDIYTKLALYVNGKYEEVRVEFSMTW